MRLMLFFDGRNPRRAWPALAEYIRPNELSAGDLQLQGDRTAPVETDQVEGVLADINANRRDVAGQRFA
jgi:hypothetical protein